MSAIVTIDESVIPYRPGNVQPVLCDVHAYPEWWPRPWKISPAGASPSGTGARFRVRDGWVVSWEGEITSVEEKRIGLRISGGLVGEGRWGLREVIDGSAVLLRMDVDPGSAWVRLLNWRLDLRRRQARTMRLVFKALESRLAGLGVERVPEPKRPEDRPPQKLIS